MSVIVVTQHYSPDPTSTAEFMTAIAHEIARDHPVLVLSGTKDSQRQGGAEPGLEVVEIPNVLPPKRAMIRRALAAGTFALRASMGVLRRSRREDCVFVVTTPFLLPYFVIFACWLRGLPSALILYDLYPHVLVNAGVSAPGSLSVRFINLLNRWMFSAVSMVVTIGRDMERLILAYRGMSKEKIEFIPNWASFPFGYRALDSSNRFRQLLPSRFIVGLSGNLGFTHDPVTVFEAARHLSQLSQVGFLLSGWGVGWEQLKARQDAGGLPNVVLLDRVPEAELESFLAAADVWVIPYRKNLAGVSVPSRLYNILAIGRPVIALSEPHAEHSLTLSNDDVGWVVPPEDPQALAETISAIARNPEIAVEKGKRAAATVATRYTRAEAARRYRELASRLLERPAAGRPT